MEQSAISHQLRLLRAMGVIVKARSGRHLTHALWDDHVARLLDEAVYHVEHLRDTPARLGAPDWTSEAGQRRLPPPRISSPRSSPLHDDDQAGGEGGVEAGGRAQPPGRESSAPQQPQQVAHCGDGRAGGQQQRRVEVPRGEQDADS